MIRIWTHTQPTATSRPPQADKEAVSSRACIDFELIQMRMKRKTHDRCRGSAYVLVLMVSVFVAVVGLSAMTAGRIQTRTANASQDAAKAGYYAQSMVDLGLYKAMTTPGWRTTHTNDTWTPDYTWGEAIVTYKFVDEIDGDLANDPTQPVRLYGKTTVNNTVRIYSVKLLQPGGATESPEMLLNSWDPATPNAGLQNIQEWYWHGQYIEPTLPANATSWKVTRVQFKARSSTGSTTDGVTKVQLRTADASGLPTTTVLEAFTMNETALTATPTWREFTFSNVSSLTPADHLCLVLEWSQGSKAAQVELDWSATPPGGYVSTSGKEAAWFTIGAQALLYRVYGTYIASPPLAPVAGTWRQEVQ